MIHTKTVAMLLLIAVAAIGAIGIGTGQSAQAGAMILMTARVSQSMIQMETVIVIK